MVEIFGCEMTDDTTSIRDDISVVFDSVNFHEELTAKKLEKVLSDIYINWEKIADYITIIDDGKIILTENKDTLIYNYGIARMKQDDFDRLEQSEYISYRQRGLQIEVLISDESSFKKMSQCYFRWSKH